MKAPKSIKLPQGVDPDIFAPPLNKPISLPPPMAIALIAHGAPNGPEAVYHELSKIKNEVLAERFALLGERLGIEQNDPRFWARLAMSLAQIFVPGFRDGRERGPGRPRQMQEQIELFQAVREITTKGHVGPSRACELLVKKPGKWKGKNPGTLETKYHNFLKKKPMRSDPILSRLELARGESGH